MDRLLLLGAGKIGAAIAELLCSSGDYKVTIADREQELLDAINRDDVKRLVVDVEDGAAVLAAMKDQDAVVSALP